MTLFLQEKTSLAVTKSTAASKSSTDGLKIGEPRDIFEQEADRAAGEVISGDGTSLGWSLSKMSVRAPLQRKCSCGRSSDSEGECEECKEKKTLQRKPSSSAKVDIAPSIVHEVLKSPGKPLDKATRDYFEPRFGHDFSQVRIHGDAHAVESARAVNAVAYTVGRNVVFSDSKFQPSIPEGRRLLAHELTHVVQQGAGNIRLQRQPQGQGSGAALDPDDQKIVDAAQHEASNFKCNVDKVLWGILHKHFPDDGRKIAGTGCETGLPGLRTEFSATDPKDPKLTRSVPMIYVGKAFIVGIDTAHLQERVADVAKQIEAIDAWRLSNFLIDAKDLSNPKITGPLRSMDAGKLIDYKNKTKDSEVKTYVNNLLTFSTPTKSGASVDPLSNNMIMTIGKFNVVIKPDVSGAADTRTTATYRAVPPTVPIPTFGKDGKVTGFPGFSPMVTVEIVTSYATGQTPEMTSEYGRGTTSQDIGNKATSLRFHEGTHGEDFIDFLRQNPFPVFTGMDAMKKKDFEDAQDAYTKAETAWAKSLAKVNVKGDCVGKTIDEFNKGKKGYKKICP